MHTKHTQHNYYHSIENQTFTQADNSKRIVCVDFKPKDFSGKFRMKMLLE